MKYAHDAETGHLFGWQDGPVYLGKHEKPPDGALTIEPQTRMALGLLGSYLLSGFSEASAVVWSDGIDRKLFSLCRASDKIVMSARSGLYGAKRVCVVGPVCQMPVKLALLCDEVPAADIFVCPLADELYAVARLLADEMRRPCRYPLVSKSLGSLPYAKTLFDDSMEDDAFGRMAHLVAAGIPVLNEVMKGMGNPFYGKVLSKGLTWDGVACVRSAQVSMMFPHAPVSAKRYAATGMPVEMRVSQEFRAATGWMSDRVPALIVSDFIPGSVAFMRFYTLFEGKTVVWASHPSVFEKAEGMAIFRHHEGYSLCGKEWREHVNAEYAR